MNWSPNRPGMLQMRMGRTLFVFLLLPTLVGCASHGPSADSSGGRAAALDCAPFARALSGIRLSGAAADWWAQAEGRYDRAATPAVGSVLVLRRSGRLPNGHVAVVSEVLGLRTILVTQANWVHHRVAEDQPVIDVSPANDWSVVRVWWPPAGDMGVTGYAAYGFIRADRAATHEEIAAAIPRAIRIAEAE